MCIGCEFDSESFQLDASNISLFTHESSRARYQEHSKVIVTKLGSSHTTHWKAVQCIHCKGVRQDWTDLGVLEYSRHASESALPLPGYGHCVSHCVAIHLARYEGYKAATTVAKANSFG